MFFIYLHILNVSHIFLTGNNSIYYWSRIFFFICIYYAQIIFPNYSFELSFSFWYCLFVALFPIFTLKSSTVRTSWYFSFAILICSAIALYYNFSSLFGALFPWGLQKAPNLIFCFGCLTGTITGLLHHIYLHLITSFKLLFVTATHIPLLFLCHYLYIFHTLVFKFALLFPGVFLLNM